MASVGTRNDKLYFDFRYQGKRCKEYTKLENTPANMKRMEAAVKKIELALKTGEFDYEKFFPGSKKVPKVKKEVVQHVVTEVQKRPDTPLFSEFSQEWLEENVLRWKRSYRTSIKGTLDARLVPYFGEERVGNITKAMILKFRASLAKVSHETGDSELSNDRINHIMTPLRMILDDAADRYEFTSPAIGLKPLKVPRVDIEPFTLDEVKKIIRYVRPDFRNYYIVRFFTGLRTGEIDGLQWQYVDFENRQILVRETVVQGRIDTTKTLESRREVEMSPPVYEALLEQKKVSFGHSKFVFCNRAGGSYEHRNVTQRIWYPTLEKIGIKSRKPYQTRHTAATLWLAAGENPEWIARQMGHTTTQMLFTVYSRYVPNLTRRDGSAFETLLMSSGFEVSGDTL
ncbi:MAG: Arm DNA-binding domain-containing protein [Marinomonas sp.]|uniref:Arm DNA-binding domain-containing protein n=1 Tax=Marinomonas sp. TaxID=1904862 RepID=UPI003F9954C4